MMSTATHPPQEACGMSQPNQDITTLLNALMAQPDRGKVVDQLFPLVYDDLHNLAQKYFRGERPNHTLQPTALVHEAYLKLIDQTRVDWQSRAHFLAICARVMRRILVDHARTRQRIRRGGGMKMVALDSEVIPGDMADNELLELHEAMERLAALDDRQAQVVEMRFFGGLTVDEIAHVLGVSKRTVEGDWTHAKAWLKSQFEIDPAE